MVVSSRREQVLDAAIGLLGDAGVRALTHRAVDTAAELPVGSTSNLFRTRDALFDGVVDRFAARERANWDDLLAGTAPCTPDEMAAVLVAFARAATGPHRTLTLARYSILVEAARRPALRARLGTTGAHVDAWFEAWLGAVGSSEPGRDAHLILNYWIGLVLHELSNPAAGFDPHSQLAALLAALIPVTVPGRREL